MHAWAQSSNQINRQSCTPELITIGLVNGLQAKINIVMDGGMENGTCRPGVPSTTTDYDMGTGTESEPKKPNAPKKPRKYSKHTKPRYTRNAIHGSNASHAVSAMPLVIIVSCWPCQASCHAGNVASPLKFPTLRLVFATIASGRVSHVSLCSGASVPCLPCHCRWSCRSGARDVDMPYGRVIF